MLRPLMLSSFALVAMTGVARAQDSYSYSFTSGAQPIGDGNIYPRSLNPARQAPGIGGALVTTYFGAGGMGFDNVSGNPAFFDANNLLTRPARLINGEAYWTDPKFGRFLHDGKPFEVANMGLNVSAIDGADFGFDLAIASVSGPVQGYVPFQVQDADDNVASGFLFFDEPGESGTRYFQASQSYQFQTLSSPHAGREGRFELPSAQLKQMIREQNAGATGDAEIRFFDMRLGDFVTGGGTTQLAMDNVVYGGASRPDPRREPNYVPPVGPIGPNTPQYFGYAEALPEDYEGDTHAVDPFASDLSTTPVTIIGLTAERNADATGARSFTVGSSVGFSPGVSPDDPALVGHELTHVQQRADHPQTVPPGATPVGGGVGVNQVPAASPRRLRAVGASLAATAGITQGIEHTVVLAWNPQTPELQAAFAAAAAQSVELGQAIVPLFGADVTRFALTQDLLLTFDDVRPGAASPTGTPGEPAVVDPSASFYFNYSLTQYLALKDEGGQPMRLGDSGSIVTPYFDAAGDVLSYAVQTWLITDQSGVFVPVFISVPEPATLASFAVLGAIARRRRRP